MNPIVIGGGFAGLAAACRLAGDGRRPLLLERSPHLGGRATSFCDPKTGEAVDFGQHVLMRCCTAATGFLQRIGMDDAVSFQRTLSVPVLQGSRRTLLRSRPLPGPLHLAPALFGYTPLSPRQRRAVVQAAFSLLYRRTRDLDNTSFGAWLGMHGQDHDAIERLWDPICIAALNAPAAVVSTAAARKVFSDGFFRRGGADMGFFTVPLSEIVAGAERYISANGGLVRTATDVAGILVEEGAVRGVSLADGSNVRADAVVGAVPPWDLRTIVPAGTAVEPIVESALRLSWSPIVNVHLWFDRSVLAEPFFVAVDTPIQAVFDVSQLHTLAGAPGHLTHIVVSQSAAEGWMNLPDKEIVHIVRTALADLVPPADDARVVRALVLRRPRATFVPSPGSDRLRPGFATPTRGLFLAGDWTSTGWPSTLEGAVRSGVFAAARAESLDA